MFARMVLTGSVFAILAVFVYLATFMYPAGAQTMHAAAWRTR